MSDGATQQQITALQTELNVLNRTVGGLTQAVTTMTDLWRSQETAATAGRSRLNEKVETLSGEVRDLKGTVTNLGEKVTTIEPSVKSFNEEKLRIEGAKKFGLWLWSALVAAAGLLGFVIHEVFNHLPNGKP